MDSAGSWFKKALVPLLGLSLAISLLPQLKALKGRIGGTAASAPATPGGPPATGGAGSISANTDRVTAEGRLVTYPGAQVVVATDLAGTLTRLHVEEKDRVRKGELLAELKADDLKAELAEQRAKVAEAEADIRLAEINVGRAERLLTAQVGTQDTADRTRGSRDAAQARLETAR